MKPFHPTDTVATFRRTALSVTTFPQSARDTLLKAIKALEEYANDPNEIPEIRAETTAILESLKGWGLMARSLNPQLERFRANVWIDSLCDVFETQSYYREGGDPCEH